MSARAAQTSMSEISPSTRAGSRLDMSQLKNFMCASCDFWPASQLTQYLVKSSDQTPMPGLDPASPIRESAWNRSTSEEPSCSWVLNLSNWKPSAALLSLDSMTSITNPSPAPLCSAALLVVVSGTRRAPIAWRVHGCCSRKDRSRRMPSAHLGMLCSSGSAAAPTR